MPFKSKAQRRLFYAKADAGEIPMETVRKWERETPNKQSLPEHVKDAAYSAGVKLALDELGLSDDEETQHGPVDEFTEAIPDTAEGDDPRDTATSDKQRAPLWSNVQSLEAGDALQRGQGLDYSQMAGPDQYGGV